MIEPIRLSIINAIVDILQSIKPINGYNFEYTVDKNYKDIGQVVDFPFLTMLIGAAEYSPLTNSEYVSGKTMNSQNDGWLISIIGYLDSSSDLIGDFEKANQDIIKAIESNKNLGLSNVISISLLRVEEPLPIPDDDSKIIVQLTFSIKYDFISVNP